MAATSSCSGGAKLSGHTRKWGGVAGHVADDAGRDRSPRAAARAEIEEETGIGDADVSLVRTGEPFPVDDSDRGDRWVVHPFLFDCESRAVETNVETSEYEWAVPSAILLRETVPALWSSYDRVRPRVATVRDDHEHGSASLSVRALEVLRDEAAIAADGRRPGIARDGRSRATTGTRWPDWRAASATRARRWRSSPTA